MGLPNVGIDRPLGTAGEGQTMAQATIRDVAREAAVSVASVSRALNGLNNVRPEMRQRVEAAATALGFVMHAGARSLSLNRSNTVGVVLPDLHGEFFSEVLRGLDRAAASRGLQLLLSNIHANPERAVEALRSMRGRVDGMIVMAPHINPELLFAQLPSSVPAVLVNCVPYHGIRTELRINNLAGAEVMTRHLIESGRRQIVHVAGPIDNVEARERVLGYEAAMTTAGLSPRILQGDFLEESGVAAAETLLAYITDVDAVFAANDMMAIGLLMRLQRAGVAVPDQIAVAGFDDIPLARLVSPGLTTMRVDMASLGESAVARLMTVIAGEDDHKMETTDPVLVARATTGCAMPEVLVARRLAAT